MATFVPFDPGKLDDDTLKKTELVRAKFNEAVSAVKVRDSEIDRLGGEATLLVKVMGTMRALIQSIEEAK